MGTSFDRVYSVAADGGGGVIAAGYFTNTATFGGVVLAGAGGRDALLWKVGETGSTLWAVGGGGGGADELYAVAVDHSTKGVIVAGFFGGQGVATFGGNDTLTTAGRAAQMLPAASSMRI